MVLSIRCPARSSGGGPEAADDARVLVFRAAAAVRPCMRSRSCHRRFARFRCPESIDRDPVRGPPGEFDFGETGRGEHLVFHAEAAAEQGEVEAAAAGAADPICRLRRRPPVPDRGAGAGAVGELTGLGGRVPVVPVREEADRSDCRPVLRSLPPRAASRRRSRRWEAAASLRFAGEGPFRRRRTAGRCDHRAVDLNHVLGAGGGVERVLRPVGAARAFSAARPSSGCRFGLREDRPRRLRRSRLSQRTDRRTSRWPGATHSNQTGNARGPGSTPPRPTSLPPLRPKASIGDGRRQSLTFAELVVGRAAAAARSLGTLTRRAHQRHATALIHCLIGRQPSGHWSDGRSVPGRAGRRRPGRRRRAPAFAAVGVAIGIDGPAIAGVSRVTSAIALTRESTSRTSLFCPGSRSWCRSAVRPVASIPASSARKSARGMWKPWVTTTASRTPKMPRARTIVAQVSKPAWSSKTSRGGTPSRDQRLAHRVRLVVGPAVVVAGDEDLLHLARVPEPRGLPHPVAQHPAHLPVRLHQRPRHDRHFAPAARRRPSESTRPSR